MPRCARRQQLSNALQHPTRAVQRLYRLGSASGAQAALPKDKGSDDAVRCSAASAQKGPSERASEREQTCSIGHSTERACPPTQCQAGAGGAGGSPLPSAWAPIAAWPACPAAQRWRSAAAGTPCAPARPRTARCGSSSCACMCAGSGAGRRRGGGGGAGEKGCLGICGWGWGWGGMRIGVCSAGASCVCVWGGKAVWPGALAHKGRGTAWTMGSSSPAKRHPQRPAAQPPAKPASIPDMLMPETSAAAAAVTTHTSAGLRPPHSSHTHINSRRHTHTHTPSAQPAHLYPLCQLRAVSRLALGRAPRGFDGLGRAPRRVGRGGGLSRLEAGASRGLGGGGSRKPRLVGPAAQCGAGAGDG